MTRKSLFAAVGALVLLTGCVTVRSNSDVILPLEEYDEVFLGKAADAYERLPPGSSLAVLVDDYGDLRVIVRCFNDKKDCEGPE